MKKTEYTNKCSKTLTIHINTITVGERQKDILRKHVKHRGVKNKEYWTRKVNSVGLYFTSYLTLVKELVDALSSRCTPVPILDWVLCDHWSSDMALWLWWPIIVLATSLSLSIDGNFAWEDILFQKCFFSFFFSPEKITI